MVDRVVVVFFFTILLKVFCYKVGLFFIHYHCSIDHKLIIQLSFISFNIVVVSIERYLVTIAIKSRGACTCFQHPK